MRVLHAIASCNPEHGGPIAAVRLLGPPLQAMGIDQELLTLDPPGAPWVAAWPGPVHALGRPDPADRGPAARLRRWARYSPQARDWALARATDYDAVVVHGLWNYAARVARLALAGGTVPYAVFPHGMLDPWFRRQHPVRHIAKQGLWLVNEGPLVRGADAVLFTCEEERRRAGTTFFPWRARERVVAFGTAAPPPAGPGDEAVWRALVPALGQRRFLLFMGRLHPKKGCDLLIAAFARIAAAAPGLDLVIAGPDQSGWQAQLQRQAQRLGIGGRVHWPGMVSGAAKHAALRGADAFVLPSHQENFGIAVAEALACGCPVLISDKVNIWREIAGAGGGLVAPDTAAGTLDLLQQWLALDEPHRGAMRAAAAAIHAARFTDAAAARDLAAVLTEITGKPKQLSYK